MAHRERWYFTKEELENSPSRRCGIDAEKELSYRQQAANLIQDMGQKLKVTQLVINTAIVYMHRFYTFHSFTKFHRNVIATCALFLAAKVEEQPRKLEHVIKMSQICILRENVDTKSEQFQALAAELVYNENLMLRTLGFDLNVQHPHTSVVNCCQLVRATRDMAQTSYFMATNSLHLTTMCLQYKPTVVACICIYFVCKWAKFQPAKSTEGKDWWTYVDQTVNQDMLEQLTNDFVAIFKKCPSKLKKILVANRGKMPNNPSLRMIDEKRPDKLDEINKQSPNDLAKLHLNDSRHHLSKLPASHSQSTYLDPAKRNELSNHELATKHVLQNKLGLPPNKSTSQFLPKNISTHNHLTTNTSRKGVMPKENHLVDERTKSKDTLGNNSSNHFQSESSRSDKMKMHLPVISTNPLNSHGSSNNSGSGQYSDNMLDMHSGMHSNDSNELTDYSSVSNKKEMPELKMEFSDNEDSSPSDNNISFASSLMMNDSASNDSKSLSHSFVTKTNFEMPQPVYDLKLKPNSYNNYPPSQSLSNTILHKTELKDEPNSINSFFTNSVLDHPAPHKHKQEMSFSSQANATDVHMEGNLLADKSIANSHKGNMGSLASVNRIPEMKSLLRHVTMDPTREQVNVVNTTSTSTASEMEMKSASGAFLTSIPSTPRLTVKLPLPGSQSLLNQPPATIDTPIAALVDDSVIDQEDTSTHSKRHKEKHKHKHKHKEKHKHKHKHKDKDKEKNKDKYNVEQTSFKVLMSPPTEQDQQDNKQGPIKLKIAKQKVTVDEKPPPLKLKISLANHQASTAQEENTSRKRKHDKQVKLADGQSAVASKVAKKA